MAVGDFLTPEQEQSLVEKIREIERRTSGEIHIHLAARVSRRGIMSDASRAFRKLGIAKTSMRNGVLLFVAPDAKQMACLGDVAIHEKVTDNGWRDLIALLEKHFSKGNFFGGLQEGLESIGSCLIEHFPCDEGGSRNELPDEITRS